VRTEQFTAAVETELKQAGMKNGAAQNGNGRAEPKKKPLFELMSSIEEEDIDLLCSGIARGKITLFAGESGVGKSTVASKLVATHSTGEAFPYDKEPEAPGRSVIVSAEEGIADTLKKRLRIFGADMDMIAVPDRDLPPSAITANFLDRLLHEFSAALTVIDPITAYALGRNTLSPSDVRNLLMPFVPVAERHKTAIIMIAHLTKGIGKALDRILGSVEFRNVARSIFIFARDPADDERRLMTHAKCSFGPEQPTLEFFISKETGAFRWGARTNETADEALGTGEAPKQRERVQMDRAKTFLNKPSLPDRRVPSRWRKRRKS
jgi:putative DNA primase/helicase